MNGIKGTKDNFMNNEIEEDKYLEIFIHNLNKLYDDFYSRIDDKNWVNIIKEASSKLREEIIENELLKFLSGFPNLPYEVWCELDKCFNWTNKVKELRESFSVDFIKYLLWNLNNEHKLNYHLFNENMRGSYDEFIESYYKAYFALGENKLYEAHMYIKKAREMFGEHLDLIILEGKYYAGLNRVEEAINRFSYVIASDENHFIGYFLRANIFRKIGKFKEAYEDYHKCLILDSDNLAVMYELSVCTLDMGYYKEAKELYNKLLSVYPDHQEMILSLNSVNHFIVDKLEEKICIGNITVSEKYSLAKAYYEIDNYDKCIEVIGKIDDFDIESSFENKEELNSFREKIYLLIEECYKQINRFERY